MRRRLLRVRIRLSGRRWRGRRRSRSFRLQQLLLAGFDGVLGIADDVAMQHVRLRENRVGVRVFVFVTEEGLAGAAIRLAHIRAERAVPHARQSLRERIVRRDFLEASVRSGKATGGTKQKRDRSARRRSGGGVVDTAVVVGLEVAALAITARIHRTVAQRVVHHVGRAGVARVRRGSVGLRSSALCNVLQTRTTESVATLQHCRVGEKAQAYRALPSLAE